MTRPSMRTKAAEEPHRQSDALVTLGVDRNRHD